jgi:predicted MFS family arabinose efflux permease
LRRGPRTLAPRARSRRRPLRFARIRANTQPLRTPAFGRLLASYTLNSTGDYVGLVALAVLVYAETRDPLATTALFISMQFVPAFVAPILTARLDQLAPRVVLPTLYALEGAIFVALAWVATSFWLPAVLALALLDGVLMLTARGLTRGVVNAVLQPAGLLREGNGLLNVGFAFASVGGAALGGVLVATFGASTALAVDAASFAVIAGILVTCRHLPSAHAERQPFLQRVRAGFDHVRSDRIARVLVGGEALALLFFTLIVPIEVVYAEETLHADEAGYGILVSAWGAGVVLGSMGFLAVRRWSTIALILVSTAAIGIAYLGMSVARDLVLACAFSVLGGIGNGVQWVSVMTALQESTPQDLQARVTGVLESVASAMTGVGFLIGGVLTSLTSPPTAFAVSGIGVVVVVLFLAVAWRGLHPALGHTGDGPAARMSAPGVSDS